MPVAAAAPKMAALVRPRTPYQPELSCRSPRRPPSRRAAPVRAWPRSPWPWESPWSAGRSRRPRPRARTRPASASASTNSPCPTACA
ncbi:hypothetical protein [Lysobacter gummosus]|uniref:hypothetical protein n=1 Tax=Lysobacter gummosus TaxID=262324 RepID=UPI00362A5421